MIRTECEPRSTHWQELRMGKITSSEFHKIFTPGGKLSKQVEGYLHHLLAEYMLGSPIEGAETQWMIRGQDLEDDAIAAAEFELGIETDAGGFCTTDDGRIGCSPDRIDFQTETLLEIKCPKADTHVGYLLSDELEEAYKPQLQGQLWVTGFERVKIVSYYPGLPTKIMTVARDEEYISSLAQAVNAAADVLERSKTLLEQLYGPLKRPEKPAIKQRGRWFI